MLKRLIIGIWALGLGVSSPVLAQPQTPTAPIPEQTPRSRPSMLQVEDLPPGYRELPPEMQAEILAPLAIFSQRLAQANLKPDNFFAFIYPRPMELVLGFTSQLPNPAAQTQFDASLSQLNQPENQKALLAQLREQLKNFQGLTIQEVRPRPEFAQVANASAGMTVVIDMQGTPMKMDIISFRRGDRLAFTGVMYTEQPAPLAQVTKIAQTLDEKLVQSQSVGLR